MTTATTDRPTRPGSASVRRFATLGLVSLAGAILVTLYVAYLDRGFVPGDAFTYLAAGERLNAGHDLYSLGPGDRPVDLHPPYWTVPLLSPPFIAVLWRPLAALPADLGVYLWWGGSVVAIVGVLLAMARRRPALTALAAIVLAIPITYELGVGNVNGYLLVGSVASWLLYRSRHDAASGVLVALMAAVKIYPGTLAIWLVGQGRRGSLVGLAAGIAGAALMSIVGAGVQAHLRYVGIAASTGSSGASELSLAGLAKLLGVPADVAMLLPFGALVVGSIAVLLLRGRPGVSFAAAVVTMVVGSSVVNVNTPSLLLAALAPLVWPRVEDPVLESAEGEAPRLEAGANVA